MKREKIKSLAEYIELISKSEFQDSYFRGENDKYDKISSSLIRNIDNINDFIGVEEVYDNLQNAYYQEIGYQLDKTQEENFLAFSQHHGLKTNLIDFTTAPLVALYFACEREIYNAATGCVYILKKKNTIDASDFLHKYSIKGHTFNNVFYNIAINDRKVIDSFRILLENYMGLGSDKNPMETLCLLINQICSDCESEIFPNSYNYIKEYRKLWEEAAKPNFESIGADTRQLNKKYFPEINLIGGQTIVDFTVLLLLFFEDVKGHTQEIKKDIPFPQIPYLMYKTPLKFDRIQNQNGVFLYQGFLDYQKDLYGEEIGTMVQEIKPDIIVEIHNQKKIMKELDMIGINRKYIYGDFDNAARYINDKIIEKFI